MVQRDRVFGELDEFIDGVYTSLSAGDIFSATEKQIRSLGFDYFGYLLLTPSVDAHRHVFMTNKPKEWTTRYSERRYISDDLVVRHTSTTLQPFLWSQICQKGSLTEIQKTIFNEASEYRLRAGGTIPIHGTTSIRALFSVTADCGAEEFAKLFWNECHCLQIMATLIHENLLRLDLLQPRLPTIKLSQREIDVLLWASRGKTTWETSEILALSQATVGEYLSQAQKKIGANSKTQAIALAILHGIIVP